MAEDPNSVLSQDAINALFTQVPSGEPVVAPGESADGVTRTATVGDVPETPVKVVPDAPAARPWSEPAEAPAAAPPAAAPAPPPAPAPAAPPGPAPGAYDPGQLIAPLQAAIASLEQRMAQADAALARIAQLEAAVAGLNAGGGGVDKAELQAFQGKVVAQIRSIVGNLQSTPGYGLRKTFTCSGCGERGSVAVRVRCTSCDRETLAGWFPEGGRGGGKRPGPAARQARAGEGQARAPSGRTSRKAQRGPARAPR